MSWRLIFMCLLSLASTSSFTWAGPAGKVLSLTGRAVQQVAGAAPTALKTGDSVADGAYLSTSTASKMQVQLTDGSVLSLGPNSSLKLEPPNPAPTIGMLKGQLKTSVPPAAQPTRTKLLIRTRSAVMGVRGTEFQVIFNPENEITSVLTYEGSVGMVKNTGPGSELALLDLSKKVGSDPQVAIISPGKFSTLSPAAAYPTVPQKISPTQFETLKRGQASTPSVVLSPSKGALFLPPGIDPKMASTQPLGDSSRPSIEPGSPPPEGYSSAHGPSAPPAGGFLDLKTGIYVPPPPGSAFDAQMGVYIPPATFGTVDTRSGEYVPPPGMILDAKKGFVPDPGGRHSSDSSMAPKPKEGLPTTGVQLPPFPGGDNKGIPGWYQPGTPISDPFCPNCAPPPPPPPPPQTTTQIKFNITTQ